MEKINFKLFYSTLFLLIFSSSINASDWASIGAKWYYNFLTPLGENQLILLTSQKDTVINGKTCNIIRDDVYEYCMYQENDSVFYWFEDDFRLIYDFTAQEGDTIQLTYKVALWEDNTFTSIIDTVLDFDVVINSVTKIEVSGDSLKRFHTTIIEHPVYSQETGYVFSPSPYYTEKLGSSNFIVDMIVIPPSPGGYHYNLRCYQDNEIFYKSSWWESQNKPCDYITYVEKVNKNIITIKAYPNPTTQTLHIESQSAQHLIRQVNIIDISGRTLIAKEYPDAAGIDVNALPQGLYFWRVVMENGELVRGKFVKQ